MFKEMYGADVPPTLISNGASGFDGLQNGDDLVFGESGFSHGDLLREHYQYVVRSLKVNGADCRDTYTVGWHVRAW